jgi:rhodanese-related sulfurtransferase
LSECVDGQKIKPARTQPTGSRCLSVFFPHLEDSTLIPLASLLLRTTELPKDKPFVVHCKLGDRSAKSVAHWLENGFSIIWNFAGSITLGQNK